MVDIDQWEASASADRRITFATARVVHMLARYFRAHGGKAVLSPGDIADATGVANPHYCTGRLRKLGWIGGGRSEFVPLMPAPDRREKSRRDGVIHRGG
jgi:hypothetical protein